MSYYYLSLLRFYYLVLRLYPPRFREAYADEMLLVFQMQLDNSPNLNLWRTIQIFWSELRPIPILLVSAHFRERKNMNMKTNLERWFDQKQGSWKESLLAILPVLGIGTLLPVFFFISNSPINLPFQAITMILVFLALTLIIVGLIGFVLGLPRWTFMYIGILLSIISLGSVYFVALLDTDNLAFNSWSWSPLMINSIFLIIQLIFLIILVAAILWIGGKLSFTRNFSQQIKADPSLISFMLYGSVFFVLMRSYGGVSGSEIYQLLSSLLIALGGWAFLRTGKAINRIVTLITASTLASISALVSTISLTDYRSVLMNFGAFSIPVVVLIVGLSWLFSMALISIPPLLFKPST